MSRSFGGRSLTTRPPIEMGPPVISSSPAMDRSAGDLPHPDGRTNTTAPPRGGVPAPGRADEHHELAVLDVETQIIDGLDAARVRLFHVIEKYLCHWESFQCSAVKMRCGKDDRPGVASVTGATTSSLSALPSVAHPMGMGSVTSPMKRPSGP